MAVANQYDSVSQLFASGSLPVVVSDSNYVLKSFDAAGFPVLPLSTINLAAERILEEVILAIVDHRKVPTHEDLETVLGQSAVLIAPLMSFCGSHRSIDYFVSRLKEIDFVVSCANSRDRLEQLQSLKKPLSVSSQDCELIIELGDKLEVFAPKLDPTIKQGEWISVSQFLEVALIPNEDYSSFNVGGKLSCDGISIAIHGHNYNVAKLSASKAWSIFSEIRNSGGFPLTLSFENSKVLEIRTFNGEDILDDIKPLTDDTFHGFLIEVGFASQTPDSGIDWTINSQINEGSGGIHVALGTGIDAAHIDFISPYAKVSV